MRNNLALSLGCLILSSTCLAQAMNWVQVKTKNAPSVRTNYAMAYDSARQRTVLFGGFVHRVPYGSDTWVYDGKNWTKMNPTNSPKGRFGHRMVYDSRRRRIVLFGGAAGTSRTLGSAVGPVTIPLVPDIYTNITISSPNSTILVQTKGVLSSSGQGQAFLVVPRITDQRVIGMTFYHAYLVYDAKNNFYKASNPVPLSLSK